MIENALLGVAWGALGGSLVGGAIAWFTRRPHRLHAIDGIDTADIDPVLNEQIDQAAAQCAATYGQPAAAPLIADKLRLGHRIVRRSSGRWYR